jgi:L-alanine-DL-glutamate epimerase-like enolase superfamily enzyme
MATHARSGIDRIRHGSVADQVVRHAGMPVLLVRPPDNEFSRPIAATYRRIIVTLDGSQFSQAWDMPTATRMVRVLAECAPDWLEEPVAADTPWDVWQELAGASTIALAAGENVRGAGDFQAAIDSRALKVVQPDMCKWGGFSGCLPVAREVIAAGLTYCPHYLGAGIGLIASAQLLAAAGGDGLLEVDCNPNPLRELLAQPFPQIRNGCMQLSPDAGLGVAPALDAVLQWQCFSTESSH